MLSLVLGSSTHAFELMLSAFILGIAFGGLWVRRRIDAERDPVWLLGWVQVAMGIAAIATAAARPLRAQARQFAIRHRPFIVGARMVARVTPSWQLGTLESGYRATRSAWWQPQAGGVEASDPAGTVFAMVVGDSSATTSFTVSTEDFEEETTEAVASSSGHCWRTWWSCCSSVRSSLSGVNETQPCSTAQRSVPSSAPSIGVTVKQ